jgi:ribonuclease PH
MPRANGRPLDQLREVRIVTGVQKDPWGSVQIAFEDTVVLIAATVAEQVPPWLKGKGRGWITAEYSMLPGSTPGRQGRVQKGRSEEIQRLVGRSLRAMVDLTALGERLITVDCDVIQADAGTRCAAITGGCVAVELAIARLLKEGLLTASPVRRRVCAVSCTVTDGVPMLDPDYSEDHRADVDANFVFCDDGRLVEIQGTAEGEPFDTRTLESLLSLARQGADRLFQIQKNTIGR